MGRRFSFYFDRELLLLALAIRQTSLNTITAAVLAGPQRLAKPDEVVTVGPQTDWPATAACVQCQYKSPHFHPQRKGSAGT